jgi:hypothetical protein
VGSPLVRYFNALGTPDRGVQMTFVIPFPQTRRRPFIMRMASRVTAVSAKTGEKLLAAALRQQAEAMARKRISRDLIEQECRKLEGAIRAEIWRRVLLPDDVA